MSLTSGLLQAKPGKHVTEHESDRAGLKTAHHDRFGVSNFQKTMICSVNVFLCVQVDSPGEDWRCLEGKIMLEHSSADSGQTLLLSEQKCGPQMSEQKLQPAPARLQVSLRSAASPVDYSSESMSSIWHLITSAVWRDAVQSLQLSWKHFSSVSAKGGLTCVTQCTLTYRCMFTQVARPGGLRLVWTMFLLWAAGSREVLSV